MDCFVLGSGGMMPMPYRRLTSVAVRTEGDVYLFDCGEGTQVPYKAAHLGFRSLKVVVISHLHADHVLGLPGMMMLRAQMPDAEPLIVVGPPGLKRFIDHVWADLAMHINYQVTVIEWTPPSGVCPGGDLLPDGRGDGTSPREPLREAYRDERVTLHWQPLAHSTFCLGYRLQEHLRPGKFDPQAALALGVAAGPCFGQLQRGESVVTAQGTVVTPEQVMGPQRRGCHVAFVTDTGVTPALQPLLAGVDVAFLEGMFAEEHQAEAREKKHLTVGQAARAARAAGVTRLVLVHISPRYEPRQVAQLEAEAVALHPQARMARDGMTLEIPLPDFDQAT